jgi:hypothetical protein
VMKLHVVGPPQGANKSMRWRTEFPLVEGHARHDVSPRQSRRRRIHMHKTGSKLHHCHMPLTYKILQVLLHHLQHEPTQLRCGTEGKERLIPICSTNTISFLLDLLLYFLFLFSHRGGGGEMVGGHAGICRLHRSNHASFIAPWYNN